MRKQLIALFAAVFVATVLAPGAAFADTIKNPYPSYDAAVKAFLSDDRYAPGYGTEGDVCEQYAADFGVFVFGADYSFDEYCFEKFYDFSEIRAGDIVDFTFANGRGSRGGHAFVVLGRNGNKLDTVEANWSESVISRSSSHYSLSGNSLVISDASDAQLKFGYHPLNIYAGWDLNNAGIQSVFNDRYYDFQLSRYGHVSADKRAALLANKPLNNLASSATNTKIKWGNEELVEGEHYDVRTRFAEVPGQSNPVGVQVITGLGQFAGSKVVYIANTDKNDSFKALKNNPESYGLTAANLADSVVTRLSGDSALDTMKKVVETGKFKTGGTVVLANAWGYHDALTAAGIAGLENAPVVMTDGSKLSEQAATLLGSLEPTKIVVCGGKGTITDAVANAAKAAGDAKTIVRAAGDNAAGTAVDIYKKGSGWAKTAIIATSGTYHDALAAAPLSYAAHLPIFMTEWTGALSNATLKAMKDGGITQVYIAGGTYWIPDSTKQQLEKANIKVVKRLSGDTAVETSSAIAAEAIAKFKMKANNLGVATTATHYDALAGAAFCGAKKSVMVLAAGPESSSLTEFMWNNAGSISQAYIFGGSSSVSDDTMKVICAAG